MELQAISKESKEAEDLGAGKAMLEAKTEDKGDPDKETKDVKEEEEPDHYSKLRTPQEDVYAEAFYCDASALVKPGKKTAEGSTRLYKAACIILALICVILLLIIIVLGVKLQNGSAVCPVTEDPPCSRAKCQYLWGTPPQGRQTPGYRCQQCPMGWLKVDKECFYLSTTRLNWEDSQKNCTASGGSLVVIHTQKVQAFLTKKGNLPYWIGLKRNEANKWTWYDNSELTQSYWADVTEDKPCGILNSEDPPEKNWKTATCTSSAYFICHLRLSVP